jgi:hypothetical protein
LPQDTHYIPRFILKQFKEDGGLYELDKRTGNVQRRSPEAAAQFPDFYAPHIEAGIMGTWDNEASRICRSKVFGRAHVSITPDEKRRLSAWIGLFFVRSPFNHQQMGLHVEAAKSDIRRLVGYLHRNAPSILADLHAHSPGLFWQAMTLFGKTWGRQYLLGSVERRMRNDPGRFVPSTETAFHQHIESQSYLDFAQFIERMTWTWLHCPSGLVIGDSAMGRWHVPTRTPHYGVNRDGVEVTLPFTKELCLLMRKSDCGAVEGENVFCEEAHAGELNHRQIASAVAYAFGPRRLLKPQDGYGFDLEVPQDST